MIIIKNPDAKKFEEISEAIKNNEGYCCCAIEKTEDTKCPCKDFLETSNLGECHCGRYIKKEI